VALIEFLLRNWFIVIILIAVFSQFRKWSSRGGTTESKGNNNNRMPSFGGNQRLPQRTSKAPLIDSGRTLIEKGATPLASKERPFLEARERPASPFSNADSAYKQEESAIYQEISIDSPGYASLQASRQKLAQGIIWAEILGPPRAKKPFRR
jgi:hypothetical protein